jgi:hypothetical protein
MTSMSEVTARTMVGGVDSMPTEYKVKIAYEILCDVFETSTDGNRNMSQKNLTYMLSFYVMRMMESPVTLREAGMLIAGTEGRKSPYDHSSILYGIKQHVSRMSMGRRGGWGEYVSRFELFCNQLTFTHRLYYPDLDAISTNIINKRQITL